MRITIAQRHPRVFGFVRGLLIAAASVALAPAADPPILTERNEHPRLVFGPADLPELRRRTETEEGRAILRRLDTLLAQEPTALDIGYHAAGHALRWRLTGDPVAATRARELVEATLADRLKHTDPDDGAVGLWRDDYKLIFRVKPAVGVALAYDLCFEAWPAAFRREVAAALERQAAVLVDTTRGVNTNPWSNWQFSTKAAGGICALAVAGDEGTTPAVGGVLSRARAGVAAHLTELGDRGWTVEGFNYLRYPASHGAFAFFPAWRRVTGEDLGGTTVARWFLPLYAMHLVPAPAEAADGYASPFLPFFGLNYRESRTGRPYPLWERSVFRGGDFVAGLGMAREEELGAWRWTFDSCFGLAGDGSFDVIKPSDAIFALANYPFDRAERNPATALPHAWADATLGYFVLRAEWHDAHDRIAAITANPRPRRGSYSFQDAGSFRLAGLGGYWAVQRPVDRGAAIDRAKENAVVIPGTHRWHGGRVVYAEFQDDGSGTVGLDLSDVYLAPPPPEAGFEKRFEFRASQGIAARRAFAVDYSGTSGAAMLCAVVDEIEGPGERTWLLHTLETPARTTGGFVLHAANGATLQAQVIEPAGAQVEIEGGTVKVRGSGSFFVVMSVQRGRAPGMSVRGAGLQAEVRVGGREVRYRDGKLAIASPLAGPPNPP